MNFDLLQIFDDIFDHPLPCIMAIQQIYKTDTWMSCVIPNISTSQCKNWGDHNLDEPTAFTDESYDLYNKPTEIKYSKVILIQLPLRCNFTEIPYVMWWLMLCQYSKHWYLYTQHLLPHLIKAFFFNITGPEFFMQFTKVQSTATPYVSHARANHSKWQQQQHKKIIMQAKGWL